MCKVCKEWNDDIYNSFLFCMFYKEFFRWQLLWFFVFMSKRSFLVYDLNIYKWNFFIVLCFLDFDFRVIVFFGGFFCYGE